MTEQAEQVQVEIVDETDGTVYVFRGEDQAHVDDLIERWSDNSERTWVDSRPADAASEFTVDDVRDNA